MKRVLLVVAVLLLALPLSALAKMYEEPKSNLPEGAKLWIYDPAHQHVEGPYTARHPRGTGQFTVDGERAGEPVRLDARGRARWKATGLAPGTHKVAASYIPSAGSGFLSSTSSDEHIVSGKD